MGKKRNATRRESTDPDDAPELTDAWFDSADCYEGDELVRRGRPRSDAPKQAASLRLEADVVALFRAMGPGWQARINETLRKAAKLKARC